MPLHDMTAFSLSLPLLAHRHSQRCRLRPPPRSTVCAPVSCLQKEPDHTPESIRALITSSGKADQQKGILLVRQLPAATALDLLLLSVQTSKNEFIRSSAVIALGQLPQDPAVTPAAVNALRSLLATDSEYSVRAAAAAGMGYVTAAQNQISDALFESLSRALLEDPEWQVQFSCLASLGSLRESRAVPMLTGFLDSNVDLLVQASVGALGDIADSSTVPDLLKLLGSVDMMTRQRLAQALGNMTDARDEPSVIDALRTLARDQSFAVRDAAVQALKGFGCANPVKADFLTDAEKIDLEVANLLEGNEGGSAGESASDALRRRLERSFDKEFVGAFDSARDTNMEEYESLVKELRFGDPSRQTMAAIKLRQFDGKLGLRAVRLADALNPNVASERLRAVCVNLLARGSDLKKVIEVLYADPDQNVRSACCDALVDLGGGNEAVEAVTTAFREDSHWLVRISAAIALGTIGKGREDVETILIASLRPDGLNDVDPPQDSVIRRHAVTALGFLGSVKAVETFRELVKQADEAVRFRVAAALRGIQSQESVQLLRMLIDDENEEVAEMAQGSLDSLARHGLS